VSETNITHFRCRKGFSFCQSNERRINFCISPNIHSCHYPSSLFVFRLWKLLISPSFIV